METWLCHRNVPPSKDWNQYILNHLYLSICPPSKPPEEAQKAKRVGLWLPPWFQFPTTDVFFNIYAISDQLLEGILLFGGKGECMGFSSMMPVHYVLM